MPKYTSALVTGGAGFVGSHVVDALMRRRMKVYVVDDLSAGRKTNVNPNAAFYKMSVLHPGFPKLVARMKPDVVFHLAAQIDVRRSVEDPVADAEVNVIGTLKTARAALEAGARRFVFTSSGGAMFSDDLRPPYGEGVPADPVSPYGIAKRAAEMYLECERRLRGLPCVTLRLANVYGPRQAVSGGYAGVIAKFARGMFEGKPCVITGTGRQTRDYVYVGDVARAQMLAMEKNAVGTYHIGTGTQTSVLQLFRKLNAITGARQKETHVDACPGEVARSALDARKALRELGWKPEVPLEEGLRKTVDWFARNKG